MLDKDFELLGDLHIKQSLEKSNHVDTSQTLAEDTPNVGWVKYCVVYQKGAAYLHEFSIDGVTIRSSDTVLLKNLY